MKNLFSLIIIAFTLTAYCQQGVINKGVKIVIAEGSIVNIKNDYENLSLDSDQHGQIISDGEIIVGGNWYNNSSSSQVFSSINEHGVVNFSSASNQMVAGTNSTNFENLSINNNGLQLGADLYVSNSMAMVDGIVSIEDYNLWLNSETLILGEFSNSNMIATNGEGSIHRSLNGTGSFLYPLGDVTNIADYSPATISINSFSGNEDAYISIRVNNEKYAMLEDYPDYINRYWEVENNGVSAIEFDATFNYTDDDVMGSEDNLVATKFVNEMKTIHDKVVASENIMTFSDNTESAVFTAAADIVGINQFLNPEAFEIYPNPSNGSFKLESNIELNANLIVEIYDEKGILVSKDAFDALNNSNNLKMNFDLQDISKGVYILKIFSNAQLTKRKLIIK